MCFAPGVYLCLFVATPTQVEELRLVPPPVARQVSVDADCLDTAVSCGATCDPTLLTRKKVEDLGISISTCGDQSGSQVGVVFVFCLSQSINAWQVTIDFHFNHLCRQKSRLGSCTFAGLRLGKPLALC